MSLIFFSDGNTSYDCRIMHCPFFRHFLFLTYGKVLIFFFAFHSVSRSQLPLTLSTSSHFFDGVNLQSTDFLSIWFTANFYGDFHMQNPLVSYSQMSSVFILSQPLPSKAASYTWSRLRFAPLPGWRILKSPSFSSSLFPSAFLSSLLIPWSTGHLLHHPNLVSLLLQ